MLHLPHVCVLMPTFDQAHFLPRALMGLTAQRYRNWSALIVDDGSRDATAEVVQPWLDADNIRYRRNESNLGLGATLNIALDDTEGELIAYLPSDDLWFEDHLESLVVALSDDPQAVLAYSGVRHHYNRIAQGVIPGGQLQLVQAAHRRTGDRWTERRELTTDDLDRMFWTRLKARGTFVGTGQVTSDWVDHPDQRHKIVREPLGGINPYRLRHHVQEPLTFHSTVGHRIDEADRYAADRAMQTAPQPGGLKILIVGELAYNPERILALAEAGHTLYGLWTDRPYWYNWVGPLPFGHVEEVPHDGWQAAVSRIKPDVIYALLNWQAIPFVHKVMRERGDIPFVWHFKEGPFIAREHGYWRELMDLHSQADGVITTSPEMRDWFDTLGPHIANGRPSLVLDGDLPRRSRLTGSRTVRPWTEGDIHTVVPGRPIGLHPETVAELAAHRIHLHFYGEFTHGQWAGWIDRTRALAGDFVHLHPNVDQENWVEEFSRYDAGWLHSFASRNGGDIVRADWDDLNIPARMATLAAAGLPMIQRANEGHLVATQTLAASLGCGVFFTDIADLAEKLRSPKRDAAAERCWNTRDAFVFDTHVPELIRFFETVIADRAAPTASIRQAA